MDLNKYMHHTYKDDLTFMLDHYAKSFNGYPSANEITETIRFMRQINKTNTALTKLNQQYYNHIKLSLEVDYSIEDLPELWI